MDAAGTLISTTYDQILSIHASSSQNANIRVFFYRIADIRVSFFQYPARRLLSHLH